MAIKWTKQTAEEYIRKCKEKGLKYWSAKDFLKNHKTMHSIIQKFTRRTKVMTNLKNVEKINDLIDKMDYEKVYLEIETKQDKYSIEKSKPKQIGFKTQRRE